MDHDPSPGRSRSLIAVGAALAMSAVLWACGGDDSTPDPATPTTTPTTVPATSTAPETSTTIASVAVTEDTFVNLNDMTPVRGFFVDNLLGDLDATLAVANAADGGMYPTGTIIQLVPTEAMVKREPGFSPETNDWEFFELDVDGRGTTIRVRGGDEVVNRFGGSCATCHALAAPQWDFVCEQDHGCEPLPLTRDQFEALQAADPRPRA